MLKRDKKGVQESFPQSELLCAELPGIAAMRKGFIQKMRDKNTATGILQGFPQGVCCRIFVLKTTTHV